jgi:spore coat polysaccharide biosynthesis protein SpsF
MVKKITPILQARTGASRLPGKVLMQICGDSMLSHIIRRLRLASGFEQMIIATSSSPGDDAIEAECARLNVKCRRGSEDDVLLRFYEAASSCRAAHIMRICCDNPLVDPEILFNLAEFYRENDYSYVSCAQIPLGLGAEIFSFERSHRLCMKAASTAGV